MAEAMMQSAEAATVAKETVASVTYFIVREKDGKTNELPADENTKVLPGDVVKVAAGLAMR